MIAGFPFPFIIPPLRLCLASQDVGAKSIRTVCSVGSIALQPGRDFQYLGRRAGIIRAADPWLFD